MRPASSSQSGFTLLEMAIVLTIVGLIVGGIFLGQSLVHTAQLNSVISEFNRYQSAVKLFKQQYSALPGDMPNATSYWGSAGGTGADATCMNTVSTTAATCNGNGNGVILTSAVSWDEIHRFWQHLANAKMIEGSYTGVAATPGVNVPLSLYGNSMGWWVSPVSIFGSGSSFNTDYGPGHVLYITNSAAVGITPKDAWTIDQKIDDGMPATGTVLAYAWNVCTTAVNSNSLTANYTLTDTNPDCALIFQTGF